MSVYAPRPRLLLDSGVHLRRAPPPSRAIASPRRSLADLRTRFIGGSTGPGAKRLRGRIVIFAGGIPLQDGDQVVGAIGVSGGAVDQDQEVAEAGVAAY